MNNTGYSPEELYPNSPLIEVVSEVRFEPELNIQCNIDRFHNKIRSMYPDLSVQQSPQLPLFAYLFENRSKQNGIRVSLNSFSYFEKKYSGHKSFIDNFCNLVSLFLQTYKLSNFRRLGWRYVNLIPFTRERGLIPIKRFLNINIKIADFDNNNFENFSTFFISKTSCGSITIKIETQLNVVDGQESILLDFDHSITTKLSPKKIGESISNVHQETRQIFESLITESYRSYLRGGGI